MIVFKFLVGLIISLVVFVVSWFAAILITPWMAWKSVQAFFTTYWGETETLKEQPTE